MLGCRWQLTRCQRSGMVVLYQCPVYGHWNLNFIELSNVSKCVLLDFNQGLKAVRNSSLLASHGKIQAGQVYPFGYSWSTPTLGDLPALPSCELFPDPKHRLWQKWEPIGSTLEILSPPCTSQTGKEAVKVETYESRVVGLSTLGVLIGKCFQKEGAIGTTKMWGWGVILI